MAEQEKTGQQSSEGGRKTGSGGSATEKANKAAVKAVDERIEAEEKAGKALTEARQSGGQGGGTPTAAQVFSESAREMDYKTDDKGRVIGVDGKNPVSNENPDPRAVR